MDRVAVASGAALKRAGWWVMAALALIIGGYAIAVVFVPAMGARFVGDRLLVAPVAIYLHFLGSGLALAIGPFQLKAGIRSRHLNLHRLLGRIYVASVLLGGVSALVLAPMSEGGMVAHLGFGALGLLWLTTGLRAFQLIRRGDSVAHRRWIIRNYALTFAAVTLRIYLPISLTLGLPFDPAYAAIAWLCWVPNLIVAEVWFV